MVMVSAARDYINRMLQDISGMKVLILDSQTVILDFCVIISGNVCEAWQPNLFIIDEFQVSIVSVAYSQSELLQKEVFLVELVDSVSKSMESMSHLKAICFLRPTSQNIQHLRRQLANPRFGEYHLCEFLWYFFLILSSFAKTISSWLKILFSHAVFTVFSNMLKDTQIHILADSDEHEIVQQVQVNHLLLVILHNWTH